MHRGGNREIPLSLLYQIPPRQSARSAAHDDRGFRRVSVDKNDRLIGVTGRPIDVDNRLRSIVLAFTTGWRADLTPTNNPIEIKPGKLSASGLFTIHQVPTLDVARLPRIRAPQTSEEVLQNARKLASSMLERLVTTCTSRPFLMLQEANRSDGMFYAALLIGFEAHSFGIQPTVMGHNYEMGTLPKNLRLITQPIAIRPGF